ncbi:MAG: Cof-type HAD-IIB family hydrolase [Clostridia bacterium]|nr:Cof-type HAD-IIB family hydrolase [Clostridia bacterium]
MDKKYCIFLDIDGTLIGESDKAFEKNLDTIRKVRSLGHKVFVSTGRATAYLPLKLKISENFDGVISGAGAVSKVGDKEVFKSFMPHTIVEKYCQFAFENRLPAILEGQNNMYHFGFAEGFMEDSLKIAVEDRWVKLDEKNISQILTPNVPIEKFTVLGEIPKELDNVLGDNCVVLRFSNYGEILQKSRGKGKALLEIVEILDIPVERSIAMGDSMNDYDMIKTAGIGVAMGNAPDELKNIADMVTDGVDDAGVSTALAKIFKL